ncbi:WXG100 family type VII secretion target [Nocardia sp. NPDC056064]|uniref:WXG100 family type VII secretion target n=1 Tax=Nocardia sp. NPDC056064 TaxID=3345701 RepID=UPI0035DD309A
MTVGAQQTAGTLTTTQVLAWQPATLTARGDTWSAQAGELTAFDDASHRAVDAGRDFWQGSAGDAMRTAHEQRRTTTRTFLTALQDGAAAAQSGAGSLDAARTALADAIRSAEGKGYTVAEDGTVSLSASTHQTLLSQLPDASSYTTAAGALQVDADAATASVKQALESARTAAESVASAVEKAFAGLPEGDSPIQAEAPISPAPMNDSARREASAAAFRKVFGRDPSSNVDWETALALNPESTDPKYKGVDAEIKVVRIEPVPGQGVVRTSQWIEQEKVFNVPKDLGDNRTNDPNFDPEHARVTTYVDYENGIVVVRQNPSVSTSGEVDVDAPDATVWQAADGSVRVDYDAGNPHSPDPSGIWTVNGDLVFVPGQNGGDVTVHGTRTDYPSLEVYQERQDGSVKEIAVDPAVTGGEHGPVANLPFHHEVPGSDMKVFDKFKAIQQFPEGDPGPGYPGTYDLPGTKAGGTDNPPVVRKITPSDMPLG